jgi:hypothetical protein
VGLTPSMNSRRSGLMPSMNSRGTEPPSTSAGPLIRSETFDRLGVNPLTGLWTGSLCIGMRC